MIPEGSERVFVGLGKDFHHRRSVPNGSSRKLDFLDVDCSSSSNVDFSDAVAYDELIISLSRGIGV